MDGKHLLQGHASLWLGCLWIKSSDEKETRKKNSLSKENIIRKKVWQKKKQVRSERAWNLNHSGQGVCGEKEGGEVVGPVPFGDIEHVAEEEKQINK